MDLNKIMNKKRYVVYLVLPFLICTLLFGYIMNWKNTVFDTTGFDVNNVYNHIEELTSPKYRGRLTGSNGNEMALQYIENYFKQIGVEPGGENGGYYQTFRCMVPEMIGEPYFQILDDKGNVIEDFKLYEDYNIDTFIYDPNIEFSGEMLFVGTSLYDIDPELIRDKIVVARFIPSNDDREMQYVLENNGKGILYYPESIWGSRGISVAKKSVYTKNRAGSPLFVANLSLDAYNRLRKIANVNIYTYGFGYESVTPGEDAHPTGIIKGAQIRNNVRYPIIEAANILGKIEGSKKDAGYVLIYANIDGLGEGVQNKYFPGALNNASGVGTMLEIARLMKSQNSTPEKTIIFAVWNGSANGRFGSVNYVENPIYPLNKTEAIGISSIGWIKSDLLLLATGEGTNENYAYKFVQYTERLNTDVQVNSSGSIGEIMEFIKRDVPVVEITGQYSNRFINKSINTYDDNTVQLSKEKLESVGEMLADYIKYEIYGYTYPDYLNKIEIAIIVAVFLSILFIYLINMLNKIDPQIKIFNVHVEDIYYSIPFSVFVRIFYFAVPTFFIIFALIFIINIPSYFNFYIHDGAMHLNFSLFMVMKKSVLYVRQLLTSGLGVSYRGRDVAQIVFTTFGKSLLLILSSIVLAFFLGIGKGLLDAYKGRNKGELRTLGTLMVLSMPDVLIVIFGILLMPYIGKIQILRNVLGENYIYIRTFILPLLTLSVLPTAYISRITFIAVHEEMNRGYIVTAKAKGLSRLKIMLNHILIGVLIKIVDILPSLLTMIISNLIIVEYLFNYSGIVSNMLNYLERGDSVTFIGLALSIALLYVVLLTIFKMLAKLINPYRRERAY